MVPGPPARVVPGRGIAGVLKQEDSPNGQQQQRYCDKEFAHVLPPFALQVQARMNRLQSKVQ